MKTTVFAARHAPHAAELVLDPKSRRWRGTIYRYAHDPVIGNVIGTGDTKEECADDLTEQLRNS